MHGRKSNQLIVIENSQITNYVLDDKVAWEVGRPSGDNRPDIRLHSATVSRRHGKFQNVDGVWFYVDYSGKNGTVYNNKKITTGINGRVKPIILSDGDVFVFGGGEEAVINPKTIWALYLTRDLGTEWRTVDTKDYKEVYIQTADKTVHLDQPDKGTVIEEPDGIGIYMGDITYLLGDIRVTGE